MVGRFFLVGKMVQSGSHGIAVAVLFIVNVSLIFVKRSEGPDMIEIATRGSREVGGDAGCFHNDHVRDGDGQICGDADVERFGESIAG
jgi:hypothetical protein